jgi:peptidyl-prolyl cis-trans isomerase D
MDKLRSGKFVKWVMIGVIAAFVGTILFAWGMDLGSKQFGGDMTVGQIGDRKIPYKTFNEELSNRFRQEREGGELSAYKLANMREELFQQLVAQTILEEEIKALKLRASADELIQYFRQNPPPGVVSNPYFMTDSVFDTSKYYQFLDSPETYNIPGMAYLESYAAQFTIPTTQLQLIISQAVKITDLEVEDKIRSTDEKADIEYIHMSSYAADAVADSVTEAGVEAYYRANPDSFRTEGMCELAYAAIPKTPTADDEKIVLAEITDIRARIESGENFGELAVALSEDATARDSGDLGFFGAGHMVKPFEDAAFALKPGEISHPVKTRFGYHLIKVTEQNKKEKTVRANHILLKIVPSPATQDSLKAVADTLLEQVDSGAALQALAEQHRLMHRKTGFFEKGGPIPGFEGESRYVAGLRSFAFNTEKKSEIFEDDNNYYVFTLVSQVPAGQVVLERAAPKIRAALMLKKKKEAARAAMTAIFEKIKTGETTLAAAAEADDKINHSKQEGATRAAFLPNIGASSRAVYKAFTLADGELAPVMEANNGFAIVRLVKKHPLDPAAISQKIPMTRKSMAEQARYVVYTDWFAERQEKLEVVNNLSTFYAQ